MDKIWKGRIQKDTDKLVEDFTSSLGIDRKLYLYDIMGSMAHLAGLKSIGIVGQDTFKKLAEGLEKVKHYVETGKLSGYEDIHSLVEKKLIDFVGEEGKKIHTGRSRNDQVATDERMYAKEAVYSLIEELINLQENMIGLAQRQKDCIIAAYTHMQMAQPVLVAHYLLSYFEKFSRDMDGLFNCFDSADSLPLGAAACTGSGYPLNRDLVASLLKFSKKDANSMDSVSSRDFMLDIIYCCSKLMLHLSQISEDLIIYATHQFSQVEIDDAFCTGSSIMPQKKNPDLLELIRGKSAVVTGNLTQMITLLKGLPSTYNRDLQEDKRILFSAVDQTFACVEVFGRLLEKIEFKPVDKKAAGTFIQATDIADYLVKKGESFRNSHNTVGRLVGYCIQNRKDLEDLSLEELKEFSKYFGKDYYSSISLDSCIDSKVVDCGTSRQSVKLNLGKAEERIKGWKLEAGKLKEKIPDYEKLKQKLK
ncbi:MAG: argininosuccinate lyase [Actinomycetota bacterium]